MYNPHRLPQNMCCLAACTCKPSLAGSRDNSDCRRLTSSDQCLQVHASVALPSSARSWRRDAVCPPPSGRAQIVSLASLSQPLAFFRSAKLRGEVVDACMLEIAQACVSSGAKVPFRHVLEQLSDDGDVFGIALHAMALGQWAQGGQAHQQPGYDAPPFSAFSIAGALLPACIVTGAARVVCSLPKLLIQVMLACMIALA